uniref:Uncharacterized protein n=1 Tax=Arundo donax TaxID=35708 RepID=A0A0A9ASP2_ARUDO
MMLLTYALRHVGEERDNFAQKERTSLENLFIYFLHFPTT